MLVSNKIYLNSKCVYHLLNLILWFVYIDFLLVYVLVT